MHTHQWVATFGNPGNGQYREELRRAKAAIQTYIKAHHFPEERTLLRQDGQYGTGAVISDLGDFSYVTRGKDYTILDRWCSHSACGQEAWQIISQWIWNLRLELGHRLVPEPVRTTEFAPALPPQQESALTRAGTPAVEAPASGYAPPATATSWKVGRFTGTDFPLQPDGTLRCPAGSVLVPHEHRRELDGSLRVVILRAFATAVRARCANTANGTAATRTNRAKSACCSIP